MRRFSVGDLSQLNGLGDKIIRTAATTGQGYTLAMRPLPLHVTTQFDAAVIQDLNVS